jgi:acetate CoA/acetoacetate CoA-transferase beta subunit
MDLVTGAKRVIVAMQHAAKGKSKIVKKCNLPLTSIRTIDMAVTDMAVIAFPEGRATLMEIAPSVSVADVIANTDAELIIPATVLQMAI